jgi:DNA-binding MarR family transcriptional regulator
MADELPAAISEHLGPLLGRAHDEHRRITKRALAPLELSPKGFGALAVLAAEGPLSQQRLGRRQGIDRTTTVAVVDELERLGAVERRRDDADRRAYALHITRRGRRLLAAAREAVVAAEHEFLAPLGDADRERLKAALRTLLTRGA